MIAYVTRNPLLGLIMGFLKSRNIFSAENHEIWTRQKSNFFTDISSVYTKNTVIRKYSWSHRRYSTVAKRVAAKRSSNQKE